MSIPLLIVTEGKNELIDLTAKLCYGGLDPLVELCLVNNSENALEVLARQGGKLMLTILSSQGQEVYDAMKKEGYRENFLVYGNKKDLQTDWGERNVDFLDPDMSIEKASELVMEKILY